MIEHYKERWNFFYTQQEADGLLLSSDYFNPEHYPDFMKDSIIEGIDAFALLHQSTYADGSYQYGNIHFLAHDVFTAESFNWGTAVHETAHAIFNLSDEYEGCACFEGEGGGNMFKSLAACKAFNSKHGFDPNDCSELINYQGVKWYMSEKSVLFDTEIACQAFNRNNGFEVESCSRFININGQMYFRSEAGLCIMQDDGDRIVRKFQPTCATLIQQYYDQLAPIAMYSVGAVPGEQSNYYGYEAVVAMELSIKNGDWGLEVEEVCYGVSR